MRLVATACALTFAASAAPALAQQAPPRAGEVMGLRYLSWSGKAEGPNASADGLRRVDAGPPRALSSSSATRYPGIGSMARPSRYGAGSGSGSGLNGLTPASAYGAPTWNGGMARSQGSAAMPASAPTSPPLGMAPVYNTQPAYAAQPAYSQPQVDPQAQAQAQAAYQAQIQSQYQAWYQQEAQAQYQAQVEAQMQANPQLQQQAPIRLQAPAMQMSPETMPAAYQQRADAGRPMPSMSSTPASPTSMSPNAPAAADPNAPRRDALIFQIQRPTDPTPSDQNAAASQAPSSQQAPSQQAPVQQPPQSAQPQGQAYAAAGPPREGARYYSVHRAEGRQPDPIAMPESVYAPIDLAEPPAQPVQTRNVNGRLQAVVPNADPDLP